MKQSNQNALMLYSQKQEYLFDLTYACHQATEQYQQFQRQQLPFREFINNTSGDIARYDSLINSLSTTPLNSLSEQARIDRSVCLPLATVIKRTLEDDSQQMADYIRIDERRKELARLEAEQAEADFWNSPSKAREVIAATNAERAYVVPYDSLLKTVDDASVMLELAEMEDTETFPLSEEGHTAMLAWLDKHYNC